MVMPVDDARLQSSTLTVARRCRASRCCFSFCCGTPLEVLVDHGPGGDVLTLVGTVTGRITIGDDDVDLLIDVDLLLT